MCRSPAKHALKAVDSAEMAVVTEPDGKALEILYEGHAQGNGDGRQLRQETNHQGRE